MKMAFQILIALSLFVSLILCSSCTQTQIYIRKGEKMERAGNYAGAVTNYNKAIESQGFWDQDWAKLEMLPLTIAQDKYQMGDYSGAVEEYDNYIRIHPNFDKHLIKTGAVRIYLERGNAKYAAGDYEGAIADCGRALQLHPNDSNALYLQARAKADLDRLRH
jgi:tetratricopeptide (TPR) repeat protein